MGTDTKLIIPAKYGPRELIDFIRSWPEVTDAKFLVHDWAPEYVKISFKYNEEQRGLNLHMMSRDHDLDGTSMSLGYWGSSVEILTRVAKLFGGFFQKADSDETWVHIKGRLSESNGIPFFVRQAMTLSKMEDEDDLEGLQNHMKEWYAKYPRRSR